MTLESAALVNETFLKLLEQRKGFRNRAHFFAVANRIMNRVLLDYHRSRKADKRGGKLMRITLTGVHPASADPATEVPDLLAALDRLQELDPRKADVVRLRGLWGLEMPEIAETLGVSLTTVERDWRFARLWITEALE